MRVVIFDGVCNLCNKFVNLIIRRDKKSKFKFSAIGSKYSTSIESKFNVNLAELDTVVLIKGDQIFTKSVAVIKICSQLGFPYNLASIFYIIPGFFRNKIYDLVARNRYKFFGKRNSCMIPQPEIMSRFID